MVVATTSKQAKDAAEAVFADIDSLPAVTSAGEAAAPGAPLVHDDAPGNVCLDFHYGDVEKVSAAFAAADDRSSGDAGAAVATINLGTQVRIGKTILELRK